MPRYMIEITHGDDHHSCVKALQAIQIYGSHLLTHSDWGCRAGVHCGWFVAELDCSEDAMKLVPPAFRQETRIIELNSFDLEEVTRMVAKLEH